MDPRELAVLRIGGASLVLFLPILLAGVVLYGRIGLSSQSEGVDALRRIAASGLEFPVMNALFHLGPLLLIPGAVGVLVALRGEGRDGWLIVGTAFALLAVIVGSGVTYALNQGLFKLAHGFGDAATDRQLVAGLVAQMNLGTQTGAELVQSLGLGLWLLAVSIAASGASWPTWQVYLGFAGGLGFVAAGLSSVLLDVPWLGPLLGVLGALGLLLFMIWAVTTGITLLTVRPA
jgi:hypothetical protein